MGAGKFHAKLFFPFPLFCCLLDLELISQSLCTFLMMEVKVILFSEPFSEKFLVLKIRLGKQR